MKNKKMILQVCFAISLIGSASAFADQNECYITGQEMNYQLRYPQASDRPILHADAVDSVKKAALDSAKQKCLLKNSENECANFASAVKYNEVDDVYIGDTETLTYTATLVDEACLKSHPAAVTSDRCTSKGTNDGLSPFSGYTGSTGGTGSNGNAGDGDCRGRRPTYDQNSRPNPSPTSPSSSNDEQKSRERRERERHEG